jgi:hypothetical protein
MIECKEDEADRIQKMLTSIMEQKFNVWGHIVSFPVEVDVCGGDYPLVEEQEDGSIKHFTSSSWGEMVGWKEWTDARAAKRNTTARRSKRDTRETSEWPVEWGLDDDDDEAAGVHKR